jgi:membrane protein implicated in regulation of membrane protease activity
MRLETVDRPLERSLACRRSGKDTKEMELAWWHWMVLGLALGLVELVVPSFFIVWFGLGALLVGVAMLVAPAMAFSTQILLWTAASIAMTVLWFKVFRRDDGKTRSGQADEALGEIGVLVRAVEPLGVASARGEVRFQKPIMGSDVWPCLADEAIAAGERVKVLAVDGQILKVGKY